MKTCLIYLGSFPYKEDYQGVKGIQPAFLQIFHCSNIEDFQIRLNKWTPCEISQATKRSYDFCTI